MFCINIQDCCATVQGKRVLFFQQHAQHIQLPEQKQRQPQLTTEEIINNE